MGNERSTYRPIDDYAALGDCHGGALVARNGSVDWCCLGRFDAPPMLCRLLDERRGGFFSIAPQGSYSVNRRYLDRSNVLRTEFVCGDGTIAVTDFMPVGRRARASAHDYVHLNAPQWLIRIVDGVNGRVPATVCYKPSANYAREPLTLHSSPGQIASHSGPFLYHDIAGFEIEDDTAAATVEIGAGDRHAFIMTEHPARGLVPRRCADRLLGVALAFWQEWLGYCRYIGPYKESVQRSALALKLLTFAPTGAIAAALTTSLPEEVGGIRNWDYRFCWLRDASFTLYALAALGYGGEAREFGQFLRNACAATYPNLQIMYGIGGEANLSEEFVEQLAGYRNSRPVRIGNAAFRQRQIDVYGEVLDWAWLFRTLGGHLDGDTRRMLGVFADFVATHWNEPDQGLWEMRGPPRHHIHGKMMSWVTLDRAARLLGATSHWEEQKRRIVETVRERGLHPFNGHLTQAYERAGTDAALLLAPMLGFPLDDSTLRATIAAVERELRHGDFVYRYRTDDGVPGGEGAFLICSFWLVDALLNVDRYHDARALFERLLERANDVGLYAEEVDPRSGTFLGNFPQAFTHLAQIGSAVHLELYERYGRQGLAGSYADRAKLGVSATLGWRGLWAAIKATRQVGRLRSSSASVLSLGDVL